MSHQVASMKNSGNQRNDHKEVKDEKNKIEALQWLDEALWWYNWEILELWERKMNKWNQEFFMNLQNKELIIWVNQE